MRGGRGDILYQMRTLLWQQVTGISVGVSCLAAFSQGNPRVWLYPLNSKTAPMNCWKLLSLPSEDLSGGRRGVEMSGGGGAGVAVVASGLSHSVVLATSGKGLSHSKCLA